MSILPPPWRELCPQGPRGSGQDGCKQQMAALCPYKCSETVRLAPLPLQSYKKRLQIAVVPCLHAIYCQGQHPPPKCHPGAHAPAPSLASALRGWARHRSHLYWRPRDRLDTCVPQRALLHPGSWVDAPPRHNSLDKPGLCFSVVSGHGSMRHREDAVRKDMDLLERGQKRPPR